MKRAVPQYFPSRSDGGKGYVLTPSAAANTITTTNIADKSTWRTKNPGEGRTGREGNENDFTYFNRATGTNNRIPMNQMNHREVAGGDVDRDADDYQFKSHYNHHHRPVVARECDRDRGRDGRIHHMGQPFPNSANGAKSHGQEYNANHCNALSRQQQQLQQQQQQQQQRRLNDLYDQSRPQQKQHRLEPLQSSASIPIRRHVNSSSNYDSRHSQHYNHHHKHQASSNNNNNNNNQNNLLVFRDVIPAMEEDDGKSLSTQWSQRHLLRNQRERVASDVLSQSSARTEIQSKHEQQLQQEQPQYTFQRKKWKDVRITKNHYDEREDDNENEVKELQKENQHHPTSYSPIAVLKIKNKSKSSKYSYKTSNNNRNTSNHKKPYLKPKSKLASFSPSKSLSSSSTKHQKDTNQQSQQQRFVHLHHDFSERNYPLHHSNAATNNTTTSNGIKIRNSNKLSYHDMNMNNNNTTEKSTRTTTKPAPSLSSSSSVNKRQYKVWNEDSVDNENYNSLLMAKNRRSQETTTKNPKKSSSQKHHHHQHLFQSKKHQYHRQHQSVDPQKKKMTKHGSKKIREGGEEEETYYNNRHHDSKQKQKIPPPSSNNHKDEMMSPLQPKRKSQYDKNHNVSSSSSSPRSIPSKFQLPLSSTVPSSPVISSSSQKNRTKNVPYHKMTTASSVRQKPSTTASRGSSSAGTGTGTSNHNLISSPIYPPQSHSHDEMSPLDVRLGIRPNNFFHEEDKKQQQHHHQIWKRPFRKDGVVNTRDIPLSQQSDRDGPDDNESNEDQNVSRDFIDPNRAQDGNHNGHSLLGQQQQNHYRLHTQNQTGQKDQTTRNIGQGQPYFHPKSTATKKQNVPSKSTGTSKPKTTSSSTKRNEHAKIRLSMRELTRGGQDVIERRQTQLERKNQVSKSTTIHSQRGVNEDSIVNAHAIVNDEYKQIKNRKAKENLSSQSGNRHHQHSTQRHHKQSTNVNNNKLPQTDHAQNNEMEGNHQRNLQQRRRGKSNLTIDTNAKEPSTTKPPSITPTKSKNVQSAIDPFDLQAKVDESWAPSPIKVEGSFAILNHHQGKRSKSDKQKSTKKSTSRRNNTKSCPDFNEQEVEEKEFMREVAAIVIQTFFRRHLAYRLTIERYSAVITIQRFFRAIIDDQEAKRTAMESSITVLYDLAAIEIQRIWRGWWVRDCINVDNYCASVIQSNLRIYLLKRRIEKKQLAVILIQKRWRGYIVRKKVIRRGSLKKTKGRAISHSEKTLKTGSITRPLHKPNPNGSKIQTRTIRVFSKLAGGGPSDPSTVQQKKNNANHQPSTSTNQQKPMLSSSGPSKPMPVKRKTSKGSQTSSQRMGASEDVVWKWKMMRERSKEGNKMAEF